MEKIGLNELRQMFQDFYKSKEHYVQKSFSLVPEKDKSLLLINSGMAPLKPYFSGTLTPPAPRMTTCQKCLRTGDIDNVGYTARHVTFFEMLGSFSFGDYFKTQSLQWGWEFITEVLKMPVDKLWPSIYEEDEEAFDIWKNVIGVPEERIVRLGKADNFWEIGTGPCGPCSEIYFDRGEKYGCGSPDCKPGCECDRYVEFWNHVFTQFHKDDEGNYTPLAKKNIDTGMGLERLACIMQEADSIFEIDTLKYILNSVVNIANKSYMSGAAPSDISIRIITDHIRAVTFLISDGVIPSNEGRGYVLRRLLRRAVRHGKLIGIQGIFMPDLSDKVVEISKAAYPELVEKQEYIRKIITIEEEKFNETIGQGMQILDGFLAALRSSNSTVLGGDKAFKLYDTFGFPVELTFEILSEKGFDIDMNSFAAHMKSQRETARAGRKSDTDAGWAEEQHDFSNFDQTEFVGYDMLTSEAKVLGVFSASGETVSLASGEQGGIILDKTPFYAESGGQVSDKGIMSTSGTEIQLINIEKVNGVFFHKVKVISGKLEKGDTINLDVTPVHRNNICRNHTATHLLHQALKEIVGSHIKQAGSLVTENSLRFDFTHFEGLGYETLRLVEATVNQKINEFIPVHTKVVSMDEAKQMGAVALFDEKYGDTVRVVSVGDFSMELCGGTHVVNTGQIGAFKILYENGVASGVRRIEAVTAAGLYEHFVTVSESVNAITERLRTNPSGLMSKLESLLEEARKYKKELETLKKQSMSDSTGDMVKQAKDIAGIRLIVKKFTDYDINDLRSLSDELKSKHSSLIIVFASVNSGKITFMASVSDDLLDKGYHAGNIIKQVAAAAGGGGGGKADMAQAGGKDVSKVDDALALAEKIVQKV